MLSIVGNSHQARACASQGARFFGAPQIQRGFSRLFALQLSPPLVPSEICARDERCVELQLAGELLNESASIDERGQGLEVLILDRLEVSFGDLCLVGDGFESAASGFANPSQEIPGELRIGLDLSVELFAKRRAFGFQCFVDGDLCDFLLRRLLGEDGEVVGLALERVQEGVVGFLDPSRGCFEFLWLQQ